MSDKVISGAGEESRSRRRGEIMSKNTRPALEQNEGTTLVGEKSIEEGHSPATEIVQLIVESTDANPEDLDPINDYIDPDALDALVRVGPSGNLRSGVSIDFTFEEFAIEVGSDGTLSIYQNR